MEAGFYMLWAKSFSLHSKKSHITKYHNKMGQACCSWSKANVKQSNVVHSKVKLKVKPHRPIKGYPTPGKKHKN